MARQLVLIALAMIVGSGCGDDGGDRGEIRVGLLAPISGRAAAVGQSFQRVAVAAVDSINEQGGVDGHELVLVVADTRSEIADAEAEMEKLVERGVVGIVGPALSDNVNAVFPIAKREEIPIISPSSTAAVLAEADDGGFLFRNTPNDNFQGAAQAHFLVRDTAGPQIAGAAVLHEVGQYGEGLAGSFKAAFHKACNCQDAVPDTSIISFPGNLSDAEATTAINQLGALSPTYVMMVALPEDGVKLVQTWDSDPGNTPPVIPGLRFFMTDGVRVAEFVDSVGVSMTTQMGTAPLVRETSEQYGVLVDAYETRNTDDIEQQVFAANVWDAYYLLAAALARQMTDSGQHTQFGGPLLRDSLTAVSAGPGQIFHAGQYTEMIAAVRAGNEIDYDGASGPNDFDDNGETLGDYEVWRIESDGSGGFTFAQETTIDAADIADLVQPL